MPAGLGRIGRGRLISPIGAGRALPRRSPFSSSGFARLQRLLLRSSAQRKGPGLFRVDASRTFFTSEVVIRAVSRGARAVLSRFGAFVRQRARSSIRRRKGVSVPGGPPSSHLGLLKRGIFFGFDVERRSVVVGPVPLAGRRAVAPRALEEGGISRVKSFGRFGSWLAAYIRKRPYMQPALKAELPGLPGMWRNSVKAR
jgi:hypothetical protein